MMQRYFVSTVGNDRWTGKLDSPSPDGQDGPFATIQAALDAIRRLKLAGQFKEPIEVLIREGLYQLNQPIRLRGADSGTEVCPITYRAYHGETPTLSSGRCITDWHQERDGIYSAKLPGHWLFRQLFCNGQRMIRSRYPKRDQNDPLYDGWAFIESLVHPSGDLDNVGDVENPSSFRYAAPVFPRRWQKPWQSEIFVIPGKCWISDIIPIRCVDYDNRVIHLTRSVGPSRNTLGSATHLMPGNRFYVENNLEDLTEPGEWCLDTDTHTVYFRPPQGVDIHAAQVTAPCIERLVEMIGSTGEHGQPLSHVTIRGLRFTQTLTGWPTSQSYYKTPNAGASLYMENTRLCSVEDNFFDAVGGDAIRLQNHNADNRIIGNHIKNIGAYGIFVASYQKGFCRHDPDSGDVPAPSYWHQKPEDHESVVRAWPRSTGHLISRNHIHHVGIYEKHAQGVAFFGVSAPNVTVSHNHIHHIPRFGIGLMSGFGRVIIEYNHLHDLSLETCDTGGITANRWYTYKEDPELRDGPIIRYNRVFDVVGCGAYGIKAEPGGVDLAGGRIWTHYYSWAIYFDNAPMNVQVYGNITARNTLGGLMISHYGQNVDVHDNIFLDSSKSQVYLLIAGEMSGLRVERNIFSYSNPDAAYIRLTFGKMTDLQGVFDLFDRNVIHTPGGAEPVFSGVPGEAVQRMDGAAKATAIDASRAWWDSMGFDVHSIFADPKLVDPAHGNFDLEPDSPALKLGFQPMETGLSS